MRFLIFGGVGIGDTIIELALAKALKSHYRDSKVDIVISNALGSKGIIEDLLECQHYIDNAYFWNKKEPLKAARIVFQLRANKYIYGFSCTSAFKANSTPSKVCRIISCKSIIKEVKGKTGNADINVVVPENINIVEQYGYLFNILVPDGKLDIDVLDNKLIKGLIKIDSKKKKVITCCLGTNITYFYQDGEKIAKNIKEWNIKHWCNLANELAMRGYYVVFIGGKNEYEALLAINYELRDLVDTSFLGKTSIKESMSILAESDIVVGADTGMMHCAAALNRPTISLFGGTSSQVWRPYSPKNFVIEGAASCAPCYGKEYAIECSYKECMESIKVQSVLKQIENVIGE